MTRVEEIADRLAKATSGPWEYDGYWPDAHWAIETPNGEILNYSQGDTSFPEGLTEDTLKFIAHAPTDLAYLLARLESAEAVCKAYLEHHQVGQEGGTMKTYKQLTDSLTTWQAQKGQT